MGYFLLPNGLWWKVSADCGSAARASHFGDARPGIACDSCQTAFFKWLLYWPLFCCLSECGFEFYFSFLFFLFFLS